MRSTWFVALAASLLLESAWLPPVLAQPRPSDAEPLDFQPLPSPASVVPAAPNFAQYSSLPAAPMVIPPASALPSNGPVGMPPEISPNADKSRYAWYGGRWWYLQPANRWMYWSDDRWVEYQASRYGSTPAYIQPPASARRWRRMTTGASVGMPPAAYR